jgi:MFS family permease
LRWRLSLLMFLYYAIQGAFVPLFSLRLQELGLTPMEMGWACATQALAALVAPLVAGQIADRWFPAERCLAICALLSGTLLWVLADLANASAIFTGCLALWLVLGPASTLTTALSFAHLPQQGHQFGQIRLWGTIGWVVSGWLVGYWLSKPAWLARLFTVTLVPGLADAFRLAAMMAFALSGYALTLPHTPPQRCLGDRLAPLKALRLLRDPPFAVYWLCFLGVCITFPFTTQVVPLLLENLGIPRPWLSPTLTLGQSMEIVSLALLPMLLLRLGVRDTMLLGLAAWAVFLGVLTLGKPVWLVVASLSLNGLCICGLIVAGQVFANSRAPQDVRVSVQALLTVTSGLGLLAGNLLVGWVRRQVQEQFAPTFGVGAVIAASLVIFFFTGFRNDEPAFSSYGSDTLEKAERKC